MIVLQLFIEHMDCSVSIGKMTVNIIINIVPLHLYKMGLKIIHSSLDGEQI